MRPLLIAATAASAATAVLLAPRLTAQTASNEHAWVQLFSEHRLNARLALFGDLQVRRSAGGAAPQQLLLRPGLLYTVSPRLRVGAGYAFVQTERYGGAPVVVPFPEHRTWQQLLVHAATGNVAWQGRLRLEQRWIGITRVTPMNDVEVTDWRFRQRVRPMVRATVNAAEVGIDVTPLYLTAWNELFVHVGGQVNGETLDQNRASLQLGWRFSPGLRIEAGYLQQFIRRGAPGRSEINNTVLVTLWTTTGPR